MSRRAHTSPSSTASGLSGVALWLAILWFSVLPWADRHGVQAAVSETLEPGAGTFLVARRGMPDPRFARTVVLLVAYGDGGAFGLIVNRPTPLTLSQALPETELPGEGEGFVWFGGPVAPDQAAILIDTPHEPELSRRVMASVYFTTQVESLRSLGEFAAGTRYRIYSGYAGWAPSQLDAELTRGDWHVRRATAEEVFTDEPQHLWDRLIGADGTWARARTPQDPRGAHSDSGSRVGRWIVRRLEPPPLHREYFDD